MPSSDKEPLRGPGRLIRSAMGLALLSVGFWDPLKVLLAAEIPEGFFSATNQPSRTPRVLELPEDPEARRRLWQRVGPALMAQPKDPPPLILRWARPSRLAKPLADRLRQQLRRPPPPVTPTLPMAKIHRQRQYPLPVDPLRVPLRLWVVPRVSHAGWASLKLRLAKAPEKPTAVLVEGLDTCDPETAGRLSEVLGRRVYALPQNLQQTLQLKALPAEVVMSSKGLEVVEWPGPF